jgi:hypothetical protein
MRISAIKLNAAMLLSFIFHCYFLPLKVVYGCGAIMKGFSVTSHDLTSELLKKRERIECCYQDLSNAQ